MRLQRNAVLYMSLHRLFHVLLVSSWPWLAHAAPALENAVTVAAWPGLFDRLMAAAEEPEVKPGSSGFWIQGVVIIVLVLLGGTFAGLTLGLMGLDMVNLKVLSEAGNEIERRQAVRVLKLLERGRHWVLVVLLLSNVIVNESLPIFLDNVLGGGVLAVVISTALIVIFGEIIPQSVCVRYGLAIGSATVPFVLALMYLEWPIAWPIAKLLDRILGEEQGTTYRKAELKTFVALHRRTLCNLCLGPIDLTTYTELGDDQLDEDTVTIISSVLELGEKSIESIMTPLEDVFTLSEDQILDQHLVDKIAAAGYSRIPVHAQEDMSNFLGMLLVKQLISYDPDDEKPVSSFNLAPLPEAEGNMTCLEALNFFQQGRSHMLLISRAPGEPRGAVGVVSLEDVIEELIDEEILDETDVFVDVKRKIRAIRRPPLGGRIGTTAGKGIGPLLRDALNRRQADKDERSPRPSLHDAAHNELKTRFDGGFGTMGTLSRGDVEDPSHGPTAKAIEKVKVKGGTRERRAELEAAGRTYVRASPTQSGTSTPVRSASKMSAMDEHSESSPLLRGPDSRGDR